MLPISSIFFFNATATTEIYTLSLHDALPISRFANNSLRVENRTKLIALLSEVFLQRDNETWFKLLTAAEVPCSPVQTIDQVFQAPQVLHRNMVMEIEHPTAGKVRMAGIPVKFSVTP